MPRLLNFNLFLPNAKIRSPPTLTRPISTFLGASTLSEHKLPFVCACVRVWASVYVRVRLKDPTLGPNKTWPDKMRRGKNNSYGAVRRHMCPSAFGKLTQSRPERTRADQSGPGWAGQVSVESAGNLVACS